MVHTFNPGALEVGAGGSPQDKGQPGLDGKFQIRYILPCFLLANAPVLSACLLLSFS